MIKMLIEQHQIEIYDRQTIYEFSRFSKKGNSYEAEKGSTDDLVMGLVLFGWLSDQNYFKDLTDIEVLTRLKDRAEQQTMDELVPFASIYDGNGTAEEKTSEFFGKNNPEGWILDEEYTPKVRIIF